MGVLSDVVCIFDLDGTLVDSAPDLSAALNRVLTARGMDPIDPAEVRPMVGEGARALLREGFARNGALFPDGPEGDAIVEGYIADYAERISEHSTVFAGVERALEDLAADGAALAVCTNKVMRLAEPLLKDLGLRHWFDPVLGADSLPEKKPSGLPLRTIMEHRRAPRGVMIGDTTTDRLAAESAGIPSLIASFGYGERDTRLQSADRFGSYDELPNMIRERFRPARR